MIVDYHMHVRDDDDWRRRYALDAIEPYVNAARARGVDEIGFTEHVYWFRQTREVWTLPYQVERCVQDLDAYVEAVLAAKRAGLPVKLGLEVDRWPPHDDRLAEILAPYPWDYLLGSVHWVDGLAVDQEPGVWAERPVEDAWRDYFHALCELAESGHVDVLAHPDLIKIFRHRPDEARVGELWEEAAERVARTRVAIEISTAGLRKRVGVVYPDEGFLRALARRGCRITLASDAHSADVVGYELGQAVELARSVGIETVSVFERRTARQEPLG